MTIEPGHDPGHDPGPGPSARNAKTPAMAQGDRLRHRRRAGDCPRGQSRGPSAWPRALYHATEYLGPCKIRTSAMTSGYYRTSSPVTALPMIMRWISDVPSKIVKLLEVGAVSAGRWPVAGRLVSTNSARPSAFEPGPGKLRAGERQSGNPGHWRRTLAPRHSAPGLGRGHMSSSDQQSRRPRGVDRMSSALVSNIVSRN